jgi:hypothetical protein
VLEVGFATPPPEPIDEVPSWAPEARPAPPSSPPIAAPPALAPEWYAVFVPDEDGVRIACGADERFLLGLLAQPQKGRASSTLAGRAGLGSLNQHRVLAGGFFSLAALADLEARWFAWSGVRPLADGSNAAASGLLAAPHAGTTPIVYALSQPSEAWLHLTTRLERGTLEDLSHWLGRGQPEP